MRKTFNRTHLVRSHPGSTHRADGPSAARDNVRQKKGLGDVFLQTAYKSPALLSVAARLATPSSSRRFIDSITGQMLGASDPNSAVRLAHGRLAGHCCAGEEAADATPCLRHSPFACLF